MLFPLLLAKQTVEQTDESPAIWDIMTLRRCCCYGLTHWGRVTHICVSKLTIIGSDNGLLPGRRQAIIWTNDGMLLIGPLGTNCSEILKQNSHIFIQENAFENIVCEMAAILSRPQSIKGSVFIWLPNCQVWPFSLGVPGMGWPHIL